MPLRLSPEPVGPVPPPIEGGGGTTLFAKSVPPEEPAPPPVLPVPPPGPESDGGGGTTLGFPRYGAEPDRELLATPPLIPTDGGGATTFEPREVPSPLWFPWRVPLGSFALTEGGGCTTLLLSDGALPAPVLLAFTDGGGGTTSCVPKIFPIRLLTSDALPDCVGCGGTTLLAGSGTLPAARRRMSEETSVEGGGATTDGAGILSLGLRTPARSGAETGGGTTLASIVRMGAEEIWRLTAPGAGGITLLASVGLERKGSRGEAGAGATT